MNQVGKQEVDDWQTRFGKRHIGPLPEASYTVEVDVTYHCHDKCYENCVQYQAVSIIEPSRETESR